MFMKILYIKNGGSTPRTPVSGALKCHVNNVQKNGRSIFCTPVYPVLDYA
jgi:hypothetical protein